MKDKTSQKNVGGISANTLVLPVVCAIAALHILVIFLFLNISRTSANMSAIMQKSGVYTQEATSLLAGSSIMSETSGNYVLMPITENGEVNAAPLMAYAEELKNPRRGEQVTAAFRRHDVDDDVMGLIEKAAANADYLMQNQLYAISLIRTIYPVPETEPLTSIPMVPLTEEELNMTDAQKQAKAKELMLGTAYANNKKELSQNVNACVKRLQEISAAQAAQTGRRIAIYRMIMWVATILIILLFAGSFTALYIQILNPLQRFVNLIPTNSRLDEKTGFREVRLVAQAYNDVLKRRDALDEILRSAAETDTLTNLPNRYSFEQYRVALEESACAIAVLLFDINYLKQTNDTRGHHAGDMLIRSAAECISSCFGDEEMNNCFRFGGDEFAAIVKDCSPDQIRRMVDAFIKMEKERNVSISLGYAYTDEISKTTFKNLMDEADKKMYINKKVIHESPGTPETVPV